jgi:diguanylate cyclase (GGDEF)-like protein
MDKTRTPARSIRSNVLSAAFTVVATVAFFLVAAATGLTFASLRSALTADAEVQATALADALAPALGAGDTKRVEEILDHWRPANDAGILTVRGTSGQIIGRRQEPRAPDTAEANPSSGAEREGLANAHVVLPIRTAIESVGSIDLWLHSDDIYRQPLIIGGLVLLASLLALAGAWALLGRLAAQVVRPLADLASVADTIARSPDQAPRAAEAGPQEVVALARTFNAMVDSLQHKAESLDQQIQEQARTEARLDYLAHYDQITGLANRVQFHKELPRAAERAKRQSSNIAVVFLDLDDFKLVNDTLGHDVGDHLLRAVAERLTGGLRKGDFVCRLGGDEFTVILEGITSLRTAVQVVSKLIETVAKIYDIDGHALHVGVSAGIALYPVQTEDLGDLLRFADIAMYQAKSAGKNDYCVFTSELVSRASDRMSIEGELRRGIDNNEFFLVYQPQVDIRSGRIVGLEALLRWQHPSLGLVSPDYFIDVAEKSSLIVPLGRQVIAMACRQWQAWREEGLRPPRLGVNVSGRQLHEENFPDELLAAMSSSGRVQPKLELEITESLLLADTLVSKAMFHQLAALGIEWSLDDFGTGYSSLTYLAKFPITSIKIDRSFIARVPGNENSEAIVKAIVAMAHGLGMRVITEGVETREQVEYLSALGDIVAQGYFYYRPQSATVIDELLRRQGALTETEAA